MLQPRERRADDDTIAKDRPVYYNWNIRLRVRAHLRWGCPCIPGCLRTEGVESMDYRWSQMTPIYFQGPGDEPALSAGRTRDSDTGVMMTHGSVRRYLRWGNDLPRSPTTKTPRTRCRYGQTRTSDELADTVGGWMESPKDAWPIPNERQEVSTAGSDDGDYQQVPRSTCEVRINDNGQITPHSHPAARRRPGIASPRHRISPQRPKRWVFPP